MDDAVFEAVCLVVDGSGALLLTVELDGGLGRGFLEGLDLAGIEPCVEQGNEA